DRPIRRRAVEDVEAVAHLEELVVLREGVEDADVDAFRHRRRVDPAGDLDAGPVRLDQVAHDETGDLAPRIRHAVDDAVDPGQAPGLLGVQPRLARLHPEAGRRTLRPVPALTGLDARDAGDDQLGAAGEAGRRVRNDRADEDLQVRREDVAVEGDRGAAARRPDRRAVVPGEVVRDLDQIEDCLSHLLEDVLAHHLAMVRDAEDDPDVVRADPALAELPEDVWQEPGALGRPREVVDDDGRGLLAAGQVADAERPDRVAEGPGHALLADARR